MSRAVSMLPTAGAIAAGIQVVEEVDVVVVEEAEEVPELAIVRSKGKVVSPVLRPHTGADEDADHSGDVTTTGAPQEAVPSVNVAHPGARKARRW